MNEMMQFRRHRHDQPPVTSLKTMSRPQSFAPIYGAALIGALGPVAWLIADIYGRLGTWEYALDDVYIHLAMSAELARGGYGVNAGEPASASSSVTVYVALQISDSVEASVAGCAGVQLRAFKPGSGFAFFTPKALTKWVAVNV